MFFGILAALLIAVPAFATPGPISAKKAEAQRVLGEIGQLDASLGRANERLNLANIKLDARPGARSRRTGASSASRSGT